ncbi:glycosyltransferase [Bacillus sp. IITD106]|nr:glycosyltransferase [Bacillus sp. IITD106]
MQTIIILAGVPYDHLKQRPQHIASYFAQQGYKVIYISITDYTKIPPDIFKKINDRNSLINELLVQNDDKVFIIKNTVARDGLDSISLSGLMDKIYYLYINENLIYFVSFPEWITYLQKLSPTSKLIYDCLDDWESFLNDLEMGYNEELLYNERKIASVANLVIASARRLFVKMSYYNNNVYYLPNGVWNSDYENINSSNVVPHDLQLLNKPIVFFMGAIAEWVDIDLIKYAAELRPEYSFVFVGHKRCELPKLSNVYFLGSKNYEELPNYLANSRVAIIPFKVNNLTAAVTPLKLYEYLGSSTPVVTTVMPDVIGLTGSKTAINYNEFIDYLDYYICMNVLEYERESRSAKETAEMFDWSYLLDPLNSYINEDSFNLQAKDMFIREAIVKYTKFNQSDLIKNELLSLYNYLGLYESSVELFDFNLVLKGNKQIDYEKLALAYFKKGYSDQAVQLLKIHIKTTGKSLLLNYLDSLLNENDYEVLLEIFLLKLSGNIYEALRIIDEYILHEEYNPKLFGLLSGLYVELGEYETAFQIALNVLSEMNNLNLEEIFQNNTLFFIVQYLSEKRQFELAEEIALTLMKINEDWEEKALELLSDVYISQHLEKK